MTRTVVLTGGTRGIGRSAAEALLRQDAATHLVVPVRDQASTDLVGDLSSAVGSGNVLALGCDLADLGAVRAFAEDVARRVNVLSHQLLMRLLADRLTAPATAVLVSSGTHWWTLRHNYRSMPPPRWRDVEQWRRPHRSRTTRTANASCGRRPNGCSHRSPRPWPADRHRSRRPTAHLGRAKRAGQPTYRDRSEAADGAASHP